MSNEVLTVTVKGIGDFSDVVNNVGSVQKALTKLKLPDKLGDNLTKNITAFYKEYDKYQQKIAGGLKTQGDYNQVEKSLNTMRSLYQAIGADAQKLLKLDMKDLLKLDTGEFKRISDDIANIIKQIGSTKIDTTPFTKAVNDIRGVTKNSKISGEGGLLSQILGNINSGQIAEAKKALQELKNYADRVAPRQTASGDRMPGTLSVDKYNQLTSAIDTMNGAVARAEATMDPLIRKQNDLQKELEETKQKAASGIEKEFKGYNEASKDVERVTDSLKKMHQEEFSFNRQAQDIDRQIQNYFGLSQMIRKVGDIARDAFATVKDLDKAMTETAVVTNFSVGDMWDMLPTYTAQANQLGSTIRDVYEAATLYYQQGLNTNQAMGLANETLKMARIAGLDAAEATNMMTAALRGFNMEINQQSAQKINDIYSELAAITASDTKEIGSAMERTASIANSANMEFATTSAFLAQMIETTREAPENLGTAMKTIIARFQEMKQDPTKLIDSEGVAMDANKVDKALKTIGVNLMNTKGEFRDLDDVFLDISAKWDSLTQGQQRYIATIAAGSRQQSRFIAMMSNYERTMELVDAANNSAGASQRQFEKTLDSMEAKLNMLKNAWDQFTMGLMNNQLLKFGVDRLTDAFTIVNKFIDILGKLPPKPFEGITKSVLTLVTTLGMLNFGKKASRGLIMGGAGWWKGETSLTGGFAEGWKTSGQTGFFKNKKLAAEAEQQGAKDGQAYGRGWAKAVQIAQTKQQTGKGWLGQGIEQFKENKVSLGSNESVIKALYPKTQLNSEAQQIANDFLNMLRSELAKGTITQEQLPDLFRAKFDGTVGMPKFDDEALAAGLKAFDGKKIKSVGAGFSGLTSNINSAGVALSNFGMILQGTPLEPFGQILTTVGGSLLSLSTVLATTKTGFLEQWAAAYKASIANNADAVTAFEATIANEGLSFATLKSAGAMEVLGTAIWTTLWPLLAIAAAIGAVVLIAKGLDAAIETNKEQLESASDAAAAASEAYDSAKQETSELADSIAQIEETDSAFDNLVAGTAEFNEQLVTANEQISKLIDKYPMLNDPQYLSTDKNGRMRINQAGLDAVKEYQKQIQANASAMNLIQTADLNAVENQQKADELRKIKGEMTQEEHQRNLRDADLLEQRIKSETELARQNAIRVSLADKEIHNAETMSKIMADQYETRKETAKLDVEAMSKHERRQAYADYHGYTYNKSTKKITDVEGNEIDYDDNVIKDEVIEQQVILEFQEDAESLERVLSSVNSKFASGLEEQTAGSAHVISDLLSNNIETDEEMLRKVLSEKKKKKNLVDSLSEAEMAAILGISASSITDETIDKYKTDIVNKLTGNAEKIAEAQAESYSDLAAMMAKAQGNILDKNGNILGQNGKTNKQIEQAISKQISDLKPEYAHLMSSVGSQLQEFAGEDTMAAFVNKAYDIYMDKGERAGQTINELNHLIDDTNFDSAISRLSFYNKAIQSENQSIQNLGQAMKATTGEANLLGQAFDEFLGSSDWAELSENTDDFKNALGEYDAAGIQKAAEQSRTLNELLDSGAISAGGVAAALQGMDDGTIVNLNSTVLTLLSSFNRLSDAASEAHKIIEGFDPGIDTGEGEDFVKENAEKFKEYYDNGEFGNEQLQNYIKLAAGTDKWNEALRENGGNLRDTANDLKHYVTAFEDGFGSVYDKLTQGLDLEGNNISDDVKKEFEGLEFLWDENDELQINLGEFGTDDLQAYFQKALGLSEDYAKLLLQDLSNYDTELSSQLRANDIKKSLSNKEFQGSHQDSQGRFILSDSDIRAVGASLELENDINTPEGLEEATQAIEKLANTELEVFKTQNADGSQREDYEQLLADYAKTFYGQNIEDLFGVQELQQGGKFDVGKLINDSIAKGMDSNQASQTAYEAIQKASSEGITDLLYNGQLLDLSEINSYEDFLTATQKLTDSAQWYEVGQSIAEGIISYIEGKDKKEPKSKEPQTPKTDTDTSSSVRQSQTNPGNSVGAYDTGSSNKSNWENNVPGWMSSWFKKVSEDYNKPKSSEVREVEEQPLQKLYNALVKGPQAEYQARQEQNQNTSGKTGEQIQEENRAFWSNLISNSERAAEARDQKITAGIQQSQSKTKTDSAETSKAANDTSNAANNTTNAATALTNVATLLTTAGTTLNNAATALSNAANKINQTNNSNNPLIKQYAPGAPSNIPQNQSLDQKGKIEVDNTDANSKLNETKELAIQTRDTVNKGATFRIKVPGVDKLTRASEAASSLSKKAGTQTIGVKTGKVDTGTVKSATSTIKGTQADINVGANTSEAYSKVNQLLSSVRGRSAYIDIEAHVRKTGINSITIDGKTVNVRTGASGINNNISTSPMPSFGSAAKGRYGTVGPKDKGGLTLTGEKGFEIAWLPSENRSMILGASGPQMLNLPSDAVVYTHEQSKKIIKQKPIPAGSHGNTSRKRPGSSTTTSGNGGGGGGQDSTTAKQNADNAKNAAKVIQKIGYVSVWWENMSRRVDATQKKYDKNAKDLEKRFKTIGTTLNSVKNLTDAYRKNLNLSIALNKQEVEQANFELKELKRGKNWRSKQEISYSIKGDNDKSESKKETVDLGNFITYNSTYGTWEISQKAIDLVAKGGKDSKGRKISGNKEKAEAIKQSAEKEINDRNSKLKTAEENIAKAQEALEKLSNDMYETFYRWEKSINKIYLLSQRLETLGKQQTIQTKVAEIEYAKMSIGIQTAEEAQQKVNKALQEQNNLLAQEVHGRDQAIVEARQEFDNALNFKIYEDIYKANKNSPTAQGDFEAAKMAFNLLSKAGLDSIDTFDYSKALAQLNSQRYSKETYDAIKQVLDKIFEKQNNLNDSVVNAEDTVLKVYQQLEEYQTTITDFEESLLDGMEKEAEKQISRLDKINTTLSKAYKELIDEVKNKLDERRKQEDNQKTESELSQKQQRLSMLRADTSGGHAVEIAQLEKEIADAQQNYQRSLEDQLIEKLQRQGDEAEKQRQKQIDLLSIQNEIAKETGTNLAEVKELLSKPTSNKDAIKKIWLANRGYDETTIENQKKLENEFEVAWSKYVAAWTQKNELMSNDALIGTFTDISKYDDAIYKKLDSGIINVKLTDAQKKQVGWTATDFAKDGKTFNQLLKLGFTQKGAVQGLANAKGLDWVIDNLHATAKALTTDYGFTLAQVQKAYNQSQTSKTNKNYMTDKQTGAVATLTKNGKNVASTALPASGSWIQARNGSTLYSQELNRTTGEWEKDAAQYSIGAINAQQISTFGDLGKQALLSAIQTTGFGGFINKQFKSLVQATKLAGTEVKLANGWTGSIGSDGLIYQNYATGVKKWNPATKAITEDKYNDKKKAAFLAVAKRNSETSREYAQVLMNNKVYTRAQLQKMGVKKFRTGGLADYTGPAWLDGTPAKPELVLNAQDTKNFIALKDVLSKAIGSTSSVSNEYGGDATYEININVDHLNSDYDVDKVAERVKKIIVKDSSYRNVTQVRKFR